MEWSLFALAQMFVITVAVSVAFWLRIRAVRRQNEEFRDHFDALAAVPPPELHPAPADWVKEKTDGLPDVQASNPIVALVLQNALQPDDKFEQNLVTAIESSTLMAGSETANSNETEQNQRIADLEAELAAALEAADNTSSGGSGADTATESVDQEQIEELRQLLQQFTKDSREMMACIHTLEGENADLRAQLGIEDEPAPAASEPEPAATATTDEADIASTEESKAESDAESIAESGAQSTENLVADTPADAHIEDAEQTAKDVA